MIFEIPATAQHAWISAFDTRPSSIDQLFQHAAKEYQNAGVQLVDLDKVPGRRYLTLATVNAAISFHSRSPIARTLGMELLLYIGGQKQINVALNQVGVNPRTSRVVGVVVAGSSHEAQAVVSLFEKELGKGSNDQLIDDWPTPRIANVRTGFSIGDAELKAAIRKGEPLTSTIERLAVERSAMLAAKK